MFFYKLNFVILYRRNFTEVDPKYPNIRSAGEGLSSTSHLNQRNLKIKKENINKLVVQNIPQS